MSRSLPMMVLERFFDLLMVALLMLVISYFLEIDLFLIGVIIIAIAIFLYLVSKYPKKAIAIIVGYFPSRIKKFSLESIKTVARVGIKEWFVIFCYSAIIWALYYLIYYTLVVYGVHFELSMFQILVVFIAASIGMSVPSSPGGIGVVEASIVFALSRFGIGKEEALSFAIVVRMLQYIPTTLTALYIISKSDISFRTLKRP